MSCPQCQFENPADAKFCLECGQRLKRSADPMIGQQVGNLRLLERIGVGGMGVIYRAKHINLDKVYAIKFLHPQFAADEEVVERFRREAQVISSLDHPNIVRETDFGWLEGVGFYLVMELLEGETLKDVIKRGGALEPERVLHIFEQLLDALSTAHEEGVVHRDLKPENLFLLQRRGKEVLKILDFGIARIAQDTEKKKEFTVDGEVYGSPTYMSPEQARGDINRVDHRSDLYAAGVILVEALTGRPPYQGSTPAEVMLAHISTLAPRISDLRPDLRFAPELEDVIIKSLAKESEDRFASALEFWRALQPTLRRTMDIRSRTKYETPSSPQLPASYAEQKTGKMEGQVALGWFRDPPSSGNQAPPSVVSSANTPVYTPEPWMAATTPQPSGEYGQSYAGTDTAPSIAAVRSDTYPPQYSQPYPAQSPSQHGPFPHVQPVPMSLYSTGAPLSPSVVRGQVSVESPMPTATPVPSLRANPGSGEISLVGQPSPYMEMTPPPQLSNASQLSQSQPVVVSTPLRGTPPSSLPAADILPPPQPLPADSWQTTPEKLNEESQSKDRESPTGSMKGFSRLIESSQNKLLWVGIAAVLLVFGMLLYWIFRSLPSSPNDPSRVVQDAGLPPLPRRDADVLPAHKFPSAKVKPSLRPSAPPPLPQEDMVKYQPPPQMRRKPQPEPRRTSASVQNIIQAEPSRMGEQKAYRLEIKSVPLGAEIFLAGQGKIAVTPHILQFTQGARVTLHVRKEGYLPQSIEWRAEKHSEVIVQLVRDPSY